jgi:hypothetical protein
MLLLAGHVPGTIDVFFRELVHRNKKDDKSLGYLLFLQGGPGFEAARPTELSGWVKQAAAYFRIILLASSCASRSSRLLLLFIGSCSAWSVCASL